MPPSDNFIEVEKIVSKRSSREQITKSLNRDISQELIEEQPKPDHYFKVARTPDLENVSIGAFS